MDIADIPTLPDRAQRFEEITVDCYDEYEVLSSFEVYLTDALRTPFAALWGQPDTPQATPVTVLGVGETDDRAGVYLRVRHSDGDLYDILADQVWSADPGDINAIVLDDYRAFVAGGGLPFDDYEEE